jgi:ABC-type Fe3+-citrate transport system substrate-binding protein
MLMVGFGNGPRSLEDRALPHSASAAASRLRRFTVVSVLAVVALAATACGSTSSSSTVAVAKDYAPVRGVSSGINLAQCGKDTRTIKHDVGTTTVHGNPTRIVALELSFVDALTNVGIKPVGVADDGNRKVLLPQLRTAAGNYTSVGLRSTPNLQVITSLHPDLIIADTSRHKAIYAQLSKIAPTVEFASLSGTYQQVLDSEMLIAEAVNRCDPMKAKLAQHEQIMAGYQKEVPPGEHRTAIFAVSSDKLFGVQTLTSFAPGVLQQLGLKPALTSQDSVVHVTLESLFAAKPGVMFVAYASKKDMAVQWQSTSLWGQLPAVANHEYFEVDRATWSKSRGLLAAELIAKAVMKDVYGK